jgi:ATP-binding cassette subfamily B protein
MLEKYDILNRTVQENLIGIRVVKSFVRGVFENGKFDRSAAAVRDTQVFAERVIIRIMPIMQLVIYSCIIAVLWLGGNMIIGGTLLTGELVSFIAYVTQVLMSLMMLSMIFVMLVISRASVGRIVEVLDEKIDIENPAAGPAPEPRLPGAAAKIVPAVPAASAFRIVRDGSVEFRDVFFSYNGRKDNCVINGISLHIESGQFAGIIGSTGSSKSTLVQLIPRLYDVLSGSVSVGGIDVRKYDLVSLRDAVAMVLQKNVLFSGTIRDNLCWGNLHAADAEIEAACRTADAHDFILSFPAGYGTELGQGGVNLSGGQKQRLCIARALIKKPKILILDDSMSAVDTATDSRIRSALRTALPDTTKIVITQRAASLQDADIIYVLDDGKINGCGTHSQLLADNAIYREVYESQQKGNAEGGAC